MLTFRAVSAAIGFALAALGLVGLDFSSRPAPLGTAHAVWPVLTAEPIGRVGASVRGSVPMPIQTPSAHASALLAMPATHPAEIMVFWFAGAYESAPDVQIIASRFERSTEQWSPARVVVNRLQLGEALGFGVRRLGNPVAWLDGQGKIHVFVVATGMGGWAAGRIVHLRQSNAGDAFEQLAFEPMNVLPLSWLWNTSHLVRSPPLALADGGMVLPVYFEIGVKYPLLLRFGPDGSFRGMTRISRVRHLLQPTLLMQTPTQWLALMRNQSRNYKVGVAQTYDGGLTWEDRPELDLYNRDVALAGLALQRGNMFLVHNTTAAARSVLAMSESVDGVHWNQVAELEAGQPPDEFSYGAIALAGKHLWVSYTDRRKRISWQRFMLAPGAP